MVLCRMASCLKSCCELIATCKNEIKSYVKFIINIKLVQFNILLTHQALAK